MKHHWLSFGLAALIAGCATSQAHFEATDRVPRGFDIRAVERECARLGCEEPNTVVASYFADIAQRTGSACIIHILPSRHEPPWGYWDDYVRPMRELLAGSRLRLYAYAPPGRGNSKSARHAQANLEKLESLYRYHGTARRAITTRVIDGKSALLPPYRDPYCQGRPLLEVMEGARLVSPVASSAAEHARAAERAARTVLVVVDIWKRR